MNVVFAVFVLLRCGEPVQLKESGAAPVPEPIRFKACPPHTVLGPGLMEAVHCANTTPHSSCVTRPAPDISNLRINRIGPENESTGLAHGESGSDSFDTNGFVVKKTCLPSRSLPHVASPKAAVPR